MLCCLLAPKVTGCLLRFGKNGPELIICDEAHRLKNDKTATTKSLASLPCRRRVLLSGTPMQNDLEEFFAMVDFTNPGVLGSCSEFRRKFQSPILNGRSSYHNYIDHIPFSTVGRPLLLCMLFVCPQRMIVLW